MHNHYVLSKPWCNLNAVCKWIILYNINYIILFICSIRKKLIKTHNKIRCNLIHIYFYLLLCYTYFQCKVKTILRNDMNENYFLTKYKCIPKVIKNTLNTFLHLKSNTIILQPFHHKKLIHDFQFISNSCIFYNKYPDDWNISTANDFCL